MKKVKREAVLRYFFYNKFSEFEPDEIEFIDGLLDQYRTGKRSVQTKKVYTLKREANQVKTLNDTDKAIMSALRFYGTATKEKIHDYCKSIGLDRSIRSLDKPLKKLRERRLVESI